MKYSPTVTCSVSRVAATFISLGIVASSAVAPFVFAEPRSDSPTQTLQLQLDAQQTHGETATLSIHVAYTLSFLNQDAQHLRLHFDTLKPALERTTDQVTRLHVTDDDGELSFRSPLEEQGSESLDQVWESVRNVRGNIHVEYNVPAAMPIAKKRGPHIDLQAAGGGLSGSFGSFLLLPLLNGPLHVKVHWILGSGESAVSTFANGDFERTTTMRALRTALFLAGPIDAVPHKSSQHGISFYALGLPDSELKRLASWSTKLYQSELRAFHGDPAQPFRFLIRSYNGGPILSGRADDGVFMLYIPQGKTPDPEELHELIAHEAVHALIKDLDDAPGDEGDWYTEGTADYFTILIPHQSALVDRCETLTAINHEAALYYTNSLRTVTNQQITGVMWSGRNAWTVPYARGALYFANLDAQLALRHVPIRVVDLVNDASRRIVEGAPASNAVWELVLREKLGAWAVEDWKAMLSGFLLVPASQTFGASFKALPAQTGFFDLGFEHPVAVVSGARIEGLRLQSPAYLGGLRDGDIITQTPNLNPIYRNFDHSLTLHIARGSEEKTITFDPHSGSHQGFRWVLADSGSAPRSVCSQEPAAR